MNHLFSLSFLAAVMSAGVAQSQGLPALRPAGEQFVDPQGNPVRFWGVNLAAVYPEPTAADALAKRLASLQVNLVRPHHLLRQSQDWNPSMKSGSLLAYAETSRAFDPDALDRFDSLNAALRKNGIYLAFSADFTRQYREGDVDILKSDAADRAAWMAAMREVNEWGWPKNHDVRKMLPCIDERCAMLNEEFVRNLLVHVNPHSGIAYAADTQVALFEIVNEFSTEYTIICQNQLPAYWKTKVNDRWKTHARSAGVASADLWDGPTDELHRDVRAKFFRSIDEAYFQKMKATIAATGCKASITFSNLWRGDNALQLHADGATHIENHLYMNPDVVDEPNDGFYELSQSAVAGKPFIVGEINQAEGGENIARQSPYRSMLPLAAAAYGSLQDWDGLVWFAWAHGSVSLDSTGASASENRSPNLGRMMDDGMMIDHLRTAGLIFRRGLLAPSKQPMTIAVDEPLYSGDYHGLLRGKYRATPGWQNVHAFRKTFGAGSSEQQSLPWMTQTPPNPIVADTRQIAKDIVRKQLSISAPAVEAFSGRLDGNPPATLRRLAIEGSIGFATVIAVAADGRSLESSERIIVSRTFVTADGSEAAGPTIRLSGFSPSGATRRTIRTTRQGSTASGDSIAQLDGNGVLLLPAGDWRECEILHPVR